MRNYYFILFSTRGTKKLWLIFLIKALVQEKVWSKVRPVKQPFLSMFFDFKTTRFTNETLIQKLETKYFRANYARSNPFYPKSLGCMVLQSKDKNVGVLVMQKNKSVRNIQDKNFPIKALYSLWHLIFNNFLTWILTGKDKCFL